MREFRSLKASEIRTEQGDDGKQYLVGYAANYNVLSRDLGWGMYERIVPGAFKRAVAESQDVFHLVNHDPSQILGRTTSGTTVLSEDAKGLSFRTLINQDDPAAVAFATRVARGDISECSFAFQVVKAQYVDEKDPANPTFAREVRELLDVDLFDVSTVTYPAYPQTNTDLAAARMAMKADGDLVPASLRARAMVGKGLRDMEDGVCGCDCLACFDGECEDCMNESCADPNCRCWMRSKHGKRADGKKTKRVDGEDLTADCFLIVGDDDDPTTWKLPVKFPDNDKTKAHLRNALARFNQLKGVSDEQKKAAWEKLVSLCKDNGIDVAETENDSIRAKLTEAQIADLQFDAEKYAAWARAHAVEVQTSL